MLLSSERPFVGAFAFCIPGATLLCRNGLTQTVLPESDWNMANGQLGFLRNLGDPGVSAPHDTDCIGEPDPPMVCAQALLKLARWCQQRSQSASGGEPCSTSGKNESPPAHSGGGNVCGAGATLDDVVADQASGHPSDTESRRRSATTNANDRPGGVG